MFDASAVTDSIIEDFQRDGAVCIPGLFAEWIEVLEAGIEHNMAHPGPYGSENTDDGEVGRFFDDYCNWRDIPEFERVVRTSRAAEVAARLMRSETAQFFHEHVLVKEPGTSKQTPWHQDSPYYFVEGEQTVSLWTPLDPVTSSTLRVVAGSHRWPTPVRPTRWLRGDNFYDDTQPFMPVPDPDADGLSILEWPLDPGDAIAFDFRTLHGARGNHSPVRRRAFSVRFVGDDARYVDRPGRTSPPFPGHGMVDGQRLREDWFPILHP